MTPFEKIRAGALDAIAHKNGATKMKYALWQDLADRVAQESKDPSTQVGCVLVRGDRVLTVAYNGGPRGTNDRLTASASREQRLARTTHAEANAIANCARDGVSTEGAVCFVTRTPCSHCMALLIQAGVKTIRAKHDVNFHTRWCDSMGESWLLAHEAGIEVWVGDMQWDAPDMVPDKDGW